jgi:hypothetical protein
MTGSGTSSKTASSTAHWRLQSKTSNRSACVTVRGNPSNKKEPSLLSSQPATRRKTISSGAKPPFEMILAISMPIGVPRLASARRIAPVEVAEIPNRLCIDSACVPFPEAGGPKRTIRLFTPSTISGSQILRRQPPRRPAARTPATSTIGHPL